MLTHPTHDRLVALGLTGMAKALEEQRNSPTLPRSASRSGSRSWSTARPSSARTRGSSAD